MNKWSNLPNAKHIDWVLQSIKDNPDEWAAAWDAAKDATSDATRDAAWDAAWDAARDAAWAAALGAAYNAAYNAARDAAYYAAGDVARGAALDAARDAIIALIAYDDIEHYLLSSYEELRLIYELSQHPGAILLLPAAKARELIEVKNEFSEI